MSTDTIAEVYNGVVVELETMLRSRFTDITWELGRYTTLDAQDKVEHMPNGNKRITGIIVTGTGNDGKHQSSFLPVEFNDQGYPTTNDLDQTLVAVAEQLRTSFEEPA